MSYILEALKKSEHARQQGKVPNLATLPMVDAVDSAPPATTRLPWLAASALLLAVAVAGWWRPWQAPAAAAPSSPAAAESLSTPAVISAPALPAASASSVAPASVAAIPAAEPVAVAPPPVAPPQLATLSQAQTQPLPPVPAPAPAPAQTATKIVLLPALAPRPVEPATLPAAAQATPAATTRPPAAPTSTLPAPPNRVLAFYELPSAVRERIPALAISGFSYTEEPDMRMAVINDRVLRQGESAAPGITLERIASDGVVLNFSGYRFRPQR